MNSWSLVICFFVLLWASPIGPEEIQQEEPKKDDKVSELPKKASIFAVKADRIPKGNLKINDHDGVEREIFNREFRYQAASNGLFECLNGALASPQSMLVEVVILKTGVVSQAKESGKSQKLPKCAEEILFTMLFPQSVANITSDSHTIIWRIDW